MVIPRVLAKVTGNLHQSRCRAKGLGWMGESRQDGGPPSSLWWCRWPSTGQSKGFTSG